MSAIKKTVSIDEEVVREASKLNSNFSELVETALIEYMQHHRMEKAIQSFGKWSKSKERATDFVKKLRRTDDRKTK